MERQALKWREGTEPLPEEELQQQQFRVTEGLQNKEIT
jgi:hypothetical protein